MPYQQRGTSAYAHPSGMAYSDPSTPRDEHSSTPYHRAFGLPCQHQTGLSAYLSTSTYRQQPEYHYPSSAAMSEPSSASSNDDRSESRKEKKMWKKEEVISLIDVYAKKENVFKDPKVRNKDVWCAISSEMQSQEYVTCDAKSCETKFKNLKRAYTGCIDHNNKTGNNPIKKCAYYEERHSIFHGDDSKAPRAVYSSRKGLVKRNYKESTDDSSERDVDDAEDAEGEGHEEHEEEQTKKKKPRKKPQSERSELVSLFKDFVEMKEEKEDQKLEKLQEMHNEKMTFYGQFLKVFEKSIQDK